MPLQACLCPIHASGHHGCWVAALQLCPDLVVELVIRRSQGFQRALAVQEMTQSTRLVKAALPEKKW